MSRRWRPLLDLVEDVVTELSSRRARALLMMAAVGLSTGSLLASVGISMAASEQINADIAASTLDLVALTPVPDPQVAAGGLTFPDDADERATDADLVAAAGRRIDLSDTAQVPVSRTAAETYLPEEATQVDPVQVVGVTSGYLRAARTEQPDQLLWMFDSKQPVVLLGPAAAEALGVPADGALTGLRVWVNGNPYDVVGQVRGGTAGFDHAVVVPYATALQATDGDDNATMLVRTEPGAGAVVADVISLAVRPDDPSRLEASRVVSVESLRRGVSTQLDRLAAWTGSVLMALTVLLIANSMVVAVTARTAEIGLRRALGFSRGRVARVFLTEGALVGLVGGLAGSALAAVTVVVTAAVSGWSVVLEPWLVASGPLVGTTVGLLASLYPALRAAQISPALAVRSE